MGAEPGWVGGEWGRARLGGRGVRAESGWVGGARRSQSEWVGRGEEPGWEGGKWRRSQVGCRAGPTHRSVTLPPVAPAPSQLRRMQEMLQKMKQQMQDQ